MAESPTVAKKRVMIVEPRVGRFNQRNEENNVRTQQRRTTWLMKLQRIGEFFVCDKSLVFNNLGHMISVDWLRELYRQLDGTKAIGIDGITKERYGAKQRRI